MNKLLLAIVMVVFAINANASVNRKVTAVTNEISISEELTEIKLNNDQGSVESAIQKSMLGLNPNQYREKLTVKYANKSRK